MTFLTYRKKKFSFSLNKALVSKYFSLCNFMPCFLIEFLITMFLSGKTEYIHIDLGLILKDIVSVPS